MAKLSTLTLIRLDACRIQTRLFLDLFGDEVEITEELCREHFSEFDWDWAAQKLIAGQGYRTWMKLTKKLEKRAVRFEDRVRDWYARKSRSNVDYNRRCGFSEKISKWEQVMRARLWARLYNAAPRVSMERRKDEAYLLAVKDAQCDLDVIKRDRLRFVG